MTIQLQKGDIVNVEGERFIVLDVQSDSTFSCDDGAPVHDWIERLTLMQIRPERKAG